MPSDTTNRERGGRAALLDTAAPVATAAPTARRRATPPAVPATLRDDMLVTAREGAALARIGVSTWWLRVKEGRIPAPSYALGPKSPRWRLRDLRAVLEAAA